jgi:homoserine dehydrogenase
MNNEPTFLLHIGLGSVGKAFLRQLATNAGRLEAERNLQLRYCAFFTSQGGTFIPDGLSLLELGQCAATGIVSRSDALKVGDPLALLAEAGPDFWRRAIVIDTSSSGGLFPFVEGALQRGAGIVMANKRLLAGSQSEFDALWRFGAGRVRHEATVGAGLPVIETLASFVASGDPVQEVSGCMSGTLGFICSSLEAGVPFSAAVRQARELGFTEPDPRADLSGQDTTRKVLILARRLGRRLEVGEIPTEALYPSSLAGVSVEGFLEAIRELDAGYGARMQAAKSRGNTLRYVGTVGPSACEVGLREVAVDGALGSLSGPENRFIFRTERYSQYPLMIQGPGAGPEVTAAGVMVDVLAMAGALG